MSPAMARATTLVLVIGAPLAVLLTRQGGLFNHDTSWYLAATRNWLDGGTR